MRLKTTLCVAMLAGALAFAASAQAAVDFTWSQAANSANLTFTPSSDTAGATFTWDYGDGTSDPNPAHTFTAGDHSVKLTATYPVDSTGTAPPPETATKTVHVYGAVAAAFTPSVSGTFVSFANTSTGDITSYAWTFPGGTSASATPPVQSFPVGTSNATLTVSNPAYSSTATVPVTVNGAPVANFTVASNPTGIDAPVTFTSTSTDPNNDPLTYSWDFGNGLTSTAATATTTYADAGSYVVTLTVNDGHGSAASKVAVVTVLPDKAPVVSLSATPASPRVGQNVRFTATASDPDGSVTAIAWDLDNDGQFNDGSGSVVNGTFTTPGSRIVAVRATDNMGVATIAFRTIDVAAGPAGSSASSSTPGSAPSSTPQDSASSSRRHPMLSPFPIVRIRGAILRGAVRISLLSIKAPKGAAVKVVCHGKGCGKKKSVKERLKSSKTVRVHAFERVLRRGTVIEVFVTAKGTVGKYTSFTIRPNAAPARRDRCLPPGSSKPTSCAV